MPITYWAAENAMAEVDFVIQYKQQVIPIEVKSALNLRAKSLASYRSKYQPEIAIRSSLANFEINQDLHNIPLYAIGDICN